MLSKHARGEPSGIDGWVHRAVGSIFHLVFRYLLKRVSHNGLARGGRQGGPHCWGGRPAGQINPNLFSLRDFITSGTCMHAQSRAQGPRQFEELKARIVLVMDALGMQARRQRFCGKTSFDQLR